MDSNRKLIVLNNLITEDESPLRFEQHLELKDQSGQHGQVGLNFDMNDEFDPRNYYNKLEQVNTSQDSDPS